MIYLYTFFLYLVLIIFYRHCFKRLPHIVTLTCPTKKCFNILGLPYMQHLHETIDYNSSVKKLYFSLCSLTSV